jgi:hypothetical protein
VQRPAFQLLCPCGPLPPWRSCCEAPRPKLAPYRTPGFACTMPRLFARRKRATRLADSQASLQLSFRVLYGWACYCLVASLFIQLQT